VCPPLGGFAQKLEWIFSKIRVEQTSFFMAICAIDGVGPHEFLRGRKACAQVLTYQSKSGIVHMNLGRASAFLHVFGGL